MGAVKQAIHETLVELGYNDSTADFDIMFSLYGSGHENSDIVERSVNTYWTWKHAMECMYKKYVLADKSDEEIDAMYMRFYDAYDSWLDRHSGPDYLGGFESAMWKLVNAPLT